MKKLKDMIPWTRGKEIAQKQPEDTFQRLQRRMDDFIDKPFGLDWFAPKRIFESHGLYPHLDVRDEKKKIIVEAEMPGLEPNDIDVSLDGRLLTIRGEKRKEKEDKTDRYHHFERSYGRYHRTVELPAEVDPSHVDASYKRGVLKIELKKTKESEARRIEVKAA